MEPNNQVLPINIPTNPGDKKKKWWIITLIAILFVAIALVVSYLFINKLTKDDENTPPVNTAIDDIPPVNTETHQQIVADIADLMKNIGISQDAFNLDDTSKETLSHVNFHMGEDGKSFSRECFDGGDPCVKYSSTPIKKSFIIFNSIPYENIESFEKNDTFYIKPKDPSISETEYFNMDSDYSRKIVESDKLEKLSKIKESSIPETEYLYIIEKKIIKPEELLDFDGDQTKKDIHALFYNDFINGLSSEKTVTALKTYLDKQIALNTILRYEYDDIDGSLILYYPDKELGERLNPSLYAKYMDKVISYNANPDKYLDELLESSQQEFDSNNILIINTKGDAPTFKIINRDVLLNNVSILLDDKLSKEEKIKAIAGPVRYGVVLEKENNKISLWDKLKTSFSALAASSGDINNLLNQNGTIVSPSKIINIFQGVNVAGEDLGNIVIEEFSKTDGAFSSFIKNGYWANVVQRRQMGEATIEKFSNLFSDDNSTNIIYDGHGNSRGMLFMEAYYLGSSETDSDYKANVERFNKRLKDLRDKYGKESIAAFDTEYQLSDDTLSQIGIGNSDLSLFSLFGSKKSRRIFGEIDVTSKFFEKYKSNQKSLVIFDACYTGQLANAVNARVLLTAPPNSETFDSLFLTDLKKLDLYLLKNQEPGNVSFGPDDARTYDILGKFKSNLIISNSNTGTTKAERMSCNSKPDTLCTVVFNSSSGQTLAVSPGVKSVNDGTKISFNAPLENENVDAKDVVTIDARQCFTTQKMLDENKPKWSGDKDITLSWKDKVYRDWQEKDFNENGSPKVNYAIVTVKNDKALSKISGVNLTGNQDACKGEQCVSKEAYKNPAEVKLNGNQPNTDFVAMFPCIKEEYYKSCEEGVEPKIIKIIDENNEYAGFAMPQQIKFSGNCYNNINNPSDQEKEKAILVKEWSKDDSCFEKCNKGDDCISYILDMRRGSADDRTISVDEKGRETKNKEEGTDLYINDVLEKSCVESYKYNWKEDTIYHSYCSHPAAYGKHIAWVKNTEERKGINDFNSPMKRKSVLFYDGKEYDSIESNDLIDESNIELLEEVYLYGNHISYKKNINGLRHIFFDKKDLGLVSEYESYLGCMFEDGIVYENNNDDTLVYGSPDAFVDGDRVLVSSGDYNRNACSPNIGYPKAKQTWYSKELEEKLYRCCISSSSSEEICNEDYNRNGDMYITPTEGGNYNSYVKLSKGSPYFFIEPLTKTDKFFDGNKLINIPNNVNGGKVSIYGTPDTLSGLKVSFGNILFNDTNGGLYYNWEKITDSLSGGGIDKTYDLYDKHIAYQNKDGYIIYNGKKVGEKIQGDVFPLILYKNHIAFGDDINRLYFDGRYYPDVNVFSNSIVDNLESCRRNEEERENSSVNISDIIGFINDSCPEIQ